MSVKRTLLAFGALAASMLVSCNRPIGLSGRDVNTAATQTTYCDVAEDTVLSGHVDWFQTGQINSYYVTSFDVIRRGYADSAGLAHPRMNGFCTFEVPHFESDGTPACTLFYYQSAHNGSADLCVSWLNEIGVAPYDYAEVFWNAWNSTYEVTSDDAQSDGWHAVPLSEWACGKIAEAGAKPYGDPLIMGWKYSGSTNGTYADVVFRGANATYIKVVYDE
jgi:hypothetical protein